MLISLAPGSSINVKLRLFVWLEVASNTDRLNLTFVSAYLSASMTKAYPPTVHSPTKDTANSNCSGSEPTTISSNLQTLSAWITGTLGICIGVANVNVSQTFQIYQPPAGLTSWAGKNLGCKTEVKLTRDLGTIWKSNIATHRKSTKSIHIFLKKLSWPVIAIAWDMFCQNLKRRWLPSLCQPTPSACHPLSNILGFCHCPTSSQNNVRRFEAWMSETFWYTKMTLEAETGGFSQIGWQCFLWPEKGKHVVFGTTSTNFYRPWGRV